MSSLASEPIIRRSPRGQEVGAVLGRLQHHELDSIAVLLLTEVGKCLQAGKKHKLPSIAEAAVWTAFHRMRNRDDIVQAWTAFVEQPSSGEVEFSLQMLLDRSIKQMISNLSKSVHATEVSRQIPPLTTRELNSVRYMAGYVAVKLLKKYKCTYKNTRVQAKYKLFVRILQKMQAYQQPGTPDTPEEYSTLWLELIDRGGLYHINDDVFQMMVSIEMVVRRHLDVTTFDPNADTIAVICEDVLTSESIMEQWENIADIFPSKLEKYSVELITRVVKLWTAIRAHSFAKGWTMKFETRFKKGTRKTLQPEKED